MERFEKLTAAVAGLNASFKQAPRPAVEDRQILGHLPNNRVTKKRGVADSRHDRIGWVWVLNR